MKQRDLGRQLFARHPPTTLKAETKAQPPAPVGVGDGEPTCRRGSVHRALTGLRVGDHPSMRPTREDRRADHPLPVRPCSGWGLPSRPGHPGRWCALTAPFHPYLCPQSRRVQAIGGLFSVALSCGSPRLAASQHPVLGSPDLPQHRARRIGAAVTRSAHRRIPVWPTMRHRAAKFCR